MNEILSDVDEAILEGDAARAKASIQAALDAEILRDDITDECVMA